MCVFQTPYLLSLVIFCIGLFSEGAIINITLTALDVVPSNLAGTGQAVSAASAQLSKKLKLLSLLYNIYTYYISQSVIWRDMLQGGYFIFTCQRRVKI